MYTDPKYGLHMIKIIWTRGKVRSKMKSNVSIGYIDVGDGCWRPNDVTNITVTVSIYFRSQITSPINWAPLVSSTVKFLVSRNELRWPKTNLSHNQIRIRKTWPKDLGRIRCNIH